MDQAIDYENAGFLSSSSRRRPHSSTIDTSRKFSYPKCAAASRSTHALKPLAMEVRMPQCPAFEAVRCRRPIYLRPIQRTWAQLNLHVPRGKHVCAQTELIRSSQDLTSLLKRCSHHRYFGRHICLQRGRPLRRNCITHEMVSNWDS